MAGQIWAVASTGGFLYSENLSEVLRFQVQPTVKFRQFAGVKDAALQAKKNGDQFHWDVFSDVATAGTTLTETTTIPQTNFTITQGTMTVLEGGNSVPYTGILDDLSVLNVTEIINKSLKNDAKKYLDGQAYRQFNATPLRVAPTAGTNTSAITLTTNGTCSTTNNVALGKEHVKTIIDTMKERNIPPYIADDYMAIGWPTAFRKFKNDLETIHSYVDSGFQMILNGEIGRYEGCRFVEQTNIAKEAFTNGQSNWVYFFGDDTVAEGIVIPEEMRGKIPGDYGRDRGVAWYVMNGFGLVHTQAVNARIVKWDSAA